MADKTTMEMIADLESLIKPFEPCVQVLMTRSEQRWSCATAPSSGMKIRLWIWAMTWRLASLSPCASMATWQSESREAVRGLDTMRTKTLSTENIDHLMTAADIYMAQGWDVLKPLYTKWWSSKAYIDLALPDDPAEVERNAARFRPPTPKGPVVIIRGDGSRLNIPGFLREALGEEWVKEVLEEEKARSTKRN